MEDRINEYDIGHAIGISFNLMILGKGQYAVVYKAVRKCDGGVVALKKISLLDMIDEKSKQACLKEVNLLKNMHHPNIVNYIDSFIHKKRLVIVVEWAGAGDLRKQIQYAIKKKARFSERVIWKYFKQIADSVRYIHNKRIMHRDLKPANIFLKEDGTIKVGDFGLGRTLSEKTLAAYSKVGTPLYMAPELLLEKGYDFSSDVWSLGCILYELAALKSPFTGDLIRVYQILEKIQKADYCPLPSYVGKEIKDLVTSILQLDPKSRPTIDVVYEKACEAYERHSEMTLKRKSKLQKTLQSAQQKLLKQQQQQQQQQQKQQQQKQQQQQNVNQEVKQETKCDKNEKEKSQHIKKNATTIHSDSKDNGDEQQREEDLAPPQLTVDTKCSNVRDKKSKIVTKVPSYTNDFLPPSQYEDDNNKKAIKSISPRDSSNSYASKNKQIKSVDIHTSLKLNRFTIYPDELKVESKEGIGETEKIITPTPKFVLPSKIQKEETDDSLQEVDTPSSQPESPTIAPSPNINYSEKISSIPILPTPNRLFVEENMDKSTDSMSDDLKNVLGGEITGGRNIDDNEIDHSYLRSDSDTDSDSDGSYSSYSSSSSSSSSSSYSSSGSYSSGSGSGSPSPNGSGGGKDNFNNQKNSQYKSSRVETKEDYHV